MSRRSPPFDLGRRLRRIVSAGDYVITRHAWDRMEERDFARFELETLITTGEVADAHWDDEHANWNTTVLNGNVCIAIGVDDAGAEAVVITIFDLE